MTARPSFATYDPAEVYITFGGQPITGYADGTFVEIEFDEQQWNKVTGADGHTSRAKTNNYAGTITITLLATSAGNDILNSFWQADRRNNAGVVPISVLDKLGNTKWAAAYAWIRQMPTQGYSKETETREWVIDCAELLGSAGGNQIAS
ncbi:MAG: hypothetical protein DI556_09800 [Rhodovulum sulfidophilum]|uniref:DUF3277 family protein n=1 Tax=Rhodovulum sulfidophilum TaxID=35806 RepID=A0A2W5NG59_RHOSU|nr:MAG: hypothetical protein DI556_09800 [Rhodovulum sulfidophilum]